MDLGEGDLNSYLKNNHLDFKHFLPILRDTILGLVYMHSNAIAHRDIKPANVLKMQSGKFVLNDYGIGINLEGEETYDENNYSYQIGYWKLAGTRPYLGPKLREFYNLC